MSELPVLLALVIGTHARARLREAVRRSADVTFVERIPELLRTLERESRDVIAVVVEPLDGDRRSVSNVVRDLRTRMPGLPVVGYCRVGPEHSGEIRALAAAGAHELLFHGMDDSGAALRAVLDSAGQACAAERVLSELQPMMPPSLEGYIAFCVRYPEQAHTVADVARALGVHRKTFVNYAARARALPPADLLAWCRILLAAHYLGTTARTVEAVALQLDFPSDTALRNMMKRRTGLRANEVRARGGLPVVLDALRGALEAHRSLAPLSCAAPSISTSPAG